MTTPNEPVTPAPQQMPTQVSPPVSYPAPTSNQQYFTAADLEAARQQEKDKLYGRLEKQDQQLNEFKSTVDALMSDKNARDEELAKRQKAEEDVRKAAEQAELTAQQRLEQKQAEYEQQMTQLKQDTEAKLALMQRESEFQQLKSYAQRRINEEVNAGNIIPDLTEYITGETQEEIEAAITRAKEKSDNIIAGSMKLTGGTPTGGVSPTGGPSGLLDNLSSPRQLTEAEIRAMSNEEFRAYRKHIGLDRAGSGQGLFG